MRGVAIILCLILMKGALAQSSIRAFPDTNKVRLGEPFGVVVALEPGGEALWPALDLGESFDFLALDTLMWEGEAHVIQLTVAAYDSGYLAFPPLMVVQGADTLLSDPFPIYVTYPEPDPDMELHDIHEPQRVPPVWLIWVLIGIKVIWTLLLVVLMLRNRNRAVIPERSAPLSPWDEALSHLRQLEHGKAYETLVVKEFYTQLTDILRAFGEKKWNIPLMEETTGNIQRLLEDTGMSQEQVRVFVAILEEADMAKFARKEPDVVTRHSHLNRALEWLNHQKPPQDV